MRKYKILDKRFVAFGLTTLLTSLPFSALASAGWYPTHPGDVIETEVCLPKGVSSPIYLQLMPDKGSAKTVAKIFFKGLKADAYCKDSIKHGPATAGPYHLKYKWKVNVSGENGLQFFDPKTKKAYYGWPDGIASTR